MRSLIKIPLYAVAVLVLGVLSGHLTFKLLSFSRTIMVPDLRGKTMLEANNIARGKGLYVRLEGEDYDSYIHQGSVIRQDIPSGSAVKDGREIGIVISKGPRVQYVPDVVGQSVDRAESMLKDKGIRVGKVIYVHSDKIPKNTVMAQRPEPNEGGDVFKILVSLGGYESEAKPKAAAAPENGAAPGTANSGE
ncbi:MAG TPA: PASTA domain-containing protein [Dissulfurispiraceae bacterium]